jgi:NADPH-dependent 2,4-dienoyl-CoA reductase/sulfur reductase-like enzyme
LVSRPDLLSQGLDWIAKLRGAGVRLHFAHTVTAIGGADQCEDVEIKPVGRDWQVRSDAPGILLQAKTVAIGHGLVPATEALRLINVPHVFRPERGGWTPEMRADQSTPVAGIYAAGDCAGIAGAAAAGLAGEIAGLTVARHASGLSPGAYDDAVRGPRRRLARANRFGHAISQLMTLRPGLVRAMPASTVVCRCEDVTRLAIDSAVAGGAHHVNQLKSATRCGMGPCQGRMCGEAAAELVALASGRERTAAGQWTARAPLLPVPMATMVGTYTYDDIPKPTPAPA